MIKKDFLYLGTAEEIAGIQRFNTEKGGFETTHYFLDGLQELVVLYRPKS